MSDDISPELFLPKPRVQFGKFSFVEINPHLKIPILRCGLNATEPKIVDDDLSKQQNSIKPAPPVQVCF